MTLAIDSAHQMIDSIRIPTLSASVERIRTILTNPDVAINDVVDAFLQDPPLAAKVLRIANSVHYGLRESTTSVQKAVSVLGLRTLSTIVLRAGIVAAYEGTPDCEGFSLREIWKHSIFTAHVSENLARRCRRRMSDLNPQDYYTCGLLHELGKIVLYDNLGKLYVDVLRQAKQEGCGLEIVEMRVLGMRHSDAGHMAASLWLLPEPVPAVIRCHHRPTAMPALAEVTRIVSCADEIANAIAKRPHADSSILRGEISTLPGGLSEESLLQVIEAALESWKVIEA